MPGYFKIYKVMSGYVVFDQVRTNKVRLSHIWARYVMLCPVR